MDDDRLARMGSFSAVCSPPLSMMFKGRMSKSSKSKKIELTDELDDEICDALCKISKSSEELWKEVSTIFSPPTPIGSKVSDYTPFDPYKHANAPSAAARPPSEHEGDHNNGPNNALAILANTSGDRSSLAVTRPNNASQSAFNAPQFLTPYPPTTVNKMLNPPGATVPNSIPIPQIVVSKDNEKKDATSDAGNNRSTTITSLKRPKRTRSDHLAPGNAMKKPLSGKGGADAGKLNAANINSIINNTSMSDSDGSTASGDSHEDSLDTHNQHRNLASVHPNQNASALQLQSMALSSLHSISGLFNSFNHNNNNSNNSSSNTNNFGNFNNHNNSNNSQNNHNHNHNHNESSVYYNNNHNNNNLGNNSSSNAGNTSMNNFNGSNTSMYNSNNNNSNSGNHNNFSTYNDVNGGNNAAGSNCSCNNNAHNHNHNHNSNGNNTNNTNNNGNGNGNNNAGGNTANSNGINLSNLTGLSGNFSTNDKYWTEVIFCCKKLVALAGSGLAGPLSFSELVDALTLARHIMSTTAAVLNSGAYTPFPSTPIADEFNRLVGETFGNFAHNLTSNSNSNPAANLHTNLLNLNASANNHTYPFFAQGGSTPSSLPVPHSALTPPSPSPSYSSHPDTPPSPSLSMSSPLSNMGSSSSSSWGSGSSYAFDESRRKLPVPIPIPKDESSDDESPVDSPPPMSPLSTLSVVPLSPSLSPTSASEKGVKEKEGKEVKEKEGKDGNWKKPRGKKRPKYEADLMCLSCGVRQTPEWRRGPAGAKTLCNACGLHWAKVLKAEGKGDQKKAALLEAKRSQFMLAAQKRAQGTGSATSTALIKSEPLYLSPHLSSH